MDYSSLPECPFPHGPEGTPPLEYDRLRREDPVCLVRQPSGEPAWLVTRSEDIKTVLADRRFSRDLLRHGGTRQGTQFDYNADAANLLNMDPPEHTRVRRAMAPDFSLRGTSRWQGIIDQAVKEVLDRIAAGARPVDLCPSFVQELPSRVMAGLFGFSDSERRILSAAAGKFPEGRGYEDLSVYDRIGVGLSKVEELIVEVMSSPGRVATSPLLSRLAVDSGGDTQLTPTEVMESCKAIVFSVDAMSHVLACGLVQMFRHEEQLAACVADPALWPGAVEEILRYTMATPTPLARVALEDVELSGVTIRRGESVIAHATAAGWDRDVYPDPEIFDIARETRGSLTFGHGPHRCLGVPLARAQLITALTALFARFPDLRLAIPTDEVEWALGVQSLSPAALPVVFSGDDSRARR